MQLTQSRTGQLAYILAGGQSSRFGQNKALVSIQGETHLTRLANQLLCDGLEVAIVSQMEQDYSKFGFRQIFDHEPNSGPLAGVIAALTDCKRQSRPHCWLVTCDLLDWRREWFGILEGSKQISSGAEPKVAIFESAEFLPFPGRYCVSILDVAMESWAAGNRSVRGLHKLLESYVVRVPISPDLVPRSFNTKGELAQLQAEAE